MIVELFLRDNSFHSFGYIPKSGIAESYGHSIFSFWGNHHIIWHLTNSFHSHEQSSRVLFSSYLCQHLLSLIFIIIDILTGMKWYLIVVLVRISLMIGNVVHLLMYLLAIYMSSWKKMSIRVLCPFENWVFVLFWLLLRYMNSLYILHCTVCKYFLPCCTLTFHFVDSILQRRSFLI